MAGPITWQNVAAPNFSDAIRAREAAARGMSNAFDGFQDIIKKRETTDTANWEQGTKNNTAEFLAAMRQPKTTAEFEAAAGALETQRAGFGAQIDQAAVGAALDGRQSILQGRDKAGWEFDNARLTQEQAAGQDQYRSLVANGQLDEANALLAQNPQWRNQAALVDNRNAFMRQLTTDKRATQKHDNDQVLFGNNQTEFGWRGAAENHRVALQPGEIKAQEDRSKAAAQAILSSQAAIRSSDASAAASRASAANSGTQNTLAQMKLEDARKLAESEKRTALTANILKGNPYANGPATMENMAEFAKLIKDNGIGNNPDKVQSLLRAVSDSIAKGGRVGFQKDANGAISPVTVPLSKGDVIASILSAKDGTLGADDGHADNYIKNIEKVMRTTTVVDGKAVNDRLNGYQAYQELQRRAIDNKDAFQTTVDTRKKKVRN